MGPEQGEEGRGALPRTSAVGGAGGLTSHPAAGAPLLRLPGPTATGSEHRRLPASMGSTGIHPVGSSSPPQVGPRGWGRRPADGDLSGFAPEKTFWVHKPCSYIDAESEAPGDPLQGWGQQAWQMLWSHLLTGPLTPGTAVPSRATNTCLPLQLHLTPSSGDLVLGLGQPAPSPDSLWV